MISIADQLQADRNSILETLYFCEETTWDQLRKWTRPRLNRSRFYEAVISLIRDETIQVERICRSGRRPIQIIRLI